MSGFEVTYHYGPEVARRALRHYLRRKHLLTMGLATVVFIIGVALIATGTFDVATMTFIILPLAYALGLYIATRRAERIAAELENPTVKIIATDDGITFQMSDRTSTVAWRGIKNAWKFEDMWLLFPYGPSASYTLIPKSALSEEARGFLSEKLRDK